ncbi:hypothetical protein [Hymenobacter jeollabukensis]|uniref:Uncharacterized protein n=1 Tax=Hymenobacter jeollabukensis TaxID=2025313 RepID=A0A5R8WK50_9BACT|nr:hypothetical protein [Hymenobacter jeollabukensis]TLM89402.1 hypothetical protein FDY95_20225 [Hymenobacter jeollabukensis]
MSYYPQSADKARNQPTDGRSKTPPQPHRAPNDFLDYNHGPDSYQADTPAARRHSSRGWSGPDSSHDQGRR